MAWSWSHTPEAYANARENLLDLSPELIREIWAEWQAWNGDSVVPQIDVDTFDAEHARAAELPVDALASDIWEKASELATCDNGGWQAWLCPFGCDAHKAPFDREETQP